MTNKTNKAEEKKTVGGITRVKKPPVKAEEVKAEEVKAEEVKAEEVKAEEVKADFSALINKLSSISGGVTVVADVKTQRQAIEEAAPKTWADFKTYLASVNYVLTPTKRILCNVGGMTAADYTRLTDFLTVLRACIIDWQGAKMRLDSADLPKKKKAEIQGLINIKEKAVYTALKGVKALFDIEGKCKPSDVDWLASRVVTVKYRDRTNIKLGYTLSVSGNMAILSNIFKLISASHDAETALENAQSALLKKNADGIKSGVEELKTLENAQLETAEPAEN